MYLLDTSVWIEAFKKSSKFKIDNYYDKNEIVICLPVYQEILQGIREDQYYRAVKSALDHSIILENPIPKNIFEEATSIYRQARKMGITIRSSADCLIAAIAIQNKAVIVHKDRDYKKIAKFTSLEEKSI